MQITLQSYVKSVISASAFLSDRSRAASSQEEMCAELVVPAAIPWSMVTPAVQAWSQASLEVLHSQVSQTAVVLNIGINYTFAPQRTDAIFG